MDPGPVAERPGSLPATIGVAAVVVLAVVALVVTGLVRSVVDDGPERRTTAPTVVAAKVSVTEAVSALAVLRDWDRARASAWAAGDARALRRLYLRGSPAGRHDVAMLRRWGGRGLRVRGMAMQVLSVELRVRTDRRIALVVTDRLAGAVAVPVGGGTRRTLPRDGVTTRRLEFRRTAGGWVLAGVYDRPLASTAITSGSAGS
jgi:hypothetical protein